MESPLLLILHNRFKMSERAPKQLLKGYLSPPTQVYGQTSHTQRAASAGEVLLEESNASMNPKGKLSHHKC